MVLRHNEAFFKSRMYCVQTSTWEVMTVVGIVSLGRVNI